MRLNELTFDKIIKNTSFLRESENYGFSSYVCKESSLKLKSESLFGCLKYLIDIGLINSEKITVYFLNSFSESKLDYDTIIIEDLERNAVCSIIPNMREFPNRGRFRITAGMDIFDYTSWNVFKTKIKNEPEVRERIFNKIYIK